MTRPVLDASSVSSATMATGAPYDTTISVTIAEHPNRFLVVFVKTTDAGVAGVTFNGVALTKYVGNTVGHGCEIWGLVNPPVGTYNVVIDSDADEFGNSYTACFYNVHQGVPTSGANTNNATSAQATVAVQTDVDSVALMCVASGNGGRTHTPVETAIGTWQVSSQSGACSYFNGDGTNKTMTDNISGSDVWRACGLNLKAALDAGQFILWTSE